MTAPFRRTAFFALSLLAGFLGQDQSSAMADPLASLSPGSVPALSFTILVSNRTQGKAADRKTIVYTMAGDALRIDATGDGSDRSYIWNLSARTVASLDNTKHTYHSDSLNKIMGFVDFSQLLGQYAGNNPKDSVTTSKETRTVAGIPCEMTTRIHHFKGRVVGMINGDQTITQCLSEKFPGHGIYQTFQKALAALSKNSSGKSALPPPIAPLSLETVRTTDYAPGFLVRFLAAVRLYDLSRVPGRQIEKESVQTLSTRRVPDTFFSVPSGYKKEAPPALH